VDDTNEVVEAKENFYQLFEKAKQQNEATEEPEVTTAGAIDNDEDVEVVRTKRGDEAEAEATTQKATEDSVVEETAKADLKQASLKSGNYYYYNQMNLGGYPQMKSPVTAPKLVFHPYYGYIPAAPKKEGMMEADKPEAVKQVYVYRPYQGFVPVAAKKEGEEMEKKEQKFEYNPYFGFVPVSEKKMEAEVMKSEEEKREQYVYNPYYGFMPISQLKGAEKEMSGNQKYYFDPYYGFVPVIQKSEEEKKEVEEEMKEMVEEMKEVEQMIEQKDEEEMMEEVKEEIMEAMEDGQKAEKKTEKFYFHPYYGFIPASKLTDEKMKKGINMEMKYILHPYFGFVPESRKVTQQKLIQPYNPFGYKFVPYQPKNAFGYSYNNIGDKMKAMAAKVVAVEEAKAEMKSEEVVAETKREKRSPVDTLAQYPASTFPLYSNPLVEKTQESALAKSNDEPDTKSLLEEQQAIQPQSQYYNVPQQVRPGVSQQPFYFAPYQLRADHSSFPVTPLGATVAQKPLPVQSYPLFPYDPEQDKPAALAF
jgi:hypothetical protein